MRLIDLDELLKFPIRLDNYDKKNGNEHFVFGIESVLEYAENLPTVDAVEVVRCKDCKWWSEVDEDNGKKFGECKHPSYVISDTVFINEDWYCADGERKEE